MESESLGVYYISEGIVVVGQLGRGGGGYLGQFLLGMCCWPLRTPTTL